VGQISPGETKLATSSKISKWKSFFPPLSECVPYVSFQDYYPHHMCSFTSLILEVKWKPTPRNEKLEMKKTGKYTVHPQSILLSLL
jgi:hypothetical protein